MNPAIIVASIILPPIIIFYIAMYFIRKKFASVEENERRRLNERVLAKTNEYTNIIRKMENIRPLKAVDIWATLKWSDKNINIAKEQGFSQAECEAILSLLDKEIAYLKA